MNEDRRPAFFVGDVAKMPFPDEAFDLVVSTLSMHHWEDPTAGLNEIARVLRPTGRAVVWDLRPRALLLHRHRDDRLAGLPVAALHPSRPTPWEWPWRLKLTQRIEMKRRAELSESPALK